jgi:DNA-binding response OmpR family regulator
MRRPVSIDPEWHLDDVLLSRTGPAELDARLRLSVGRHRHAPTAGNPALLTLGDLVIDPDTYSARLPHKRLDLTYKEFELLKYLAQHPGWVCTRPNSWTTSGDQTSSAAPAPSTSTSAGYERNSAPTTRH